MRKLSIFLAAVLTLCPCASFACKLTHWNRVVTTAGIGNSLAAERAPDAVRYSGSCALIAKAAGNYVVDETPAAESAFHARFYVFPDVATGPVTLFTARNAAGAAVISVRFTGSAFDAAVGSGSPTASANITPRQWYAITLDWAAGHPLTVSVSGGGRGQISAFTAGSAASGDRIDSVWLGWVQGGSNGRIAVDAYSSSRQASVGLLCRGDSVPNRVIDDLDVAAVRTEFLGGNVAGGQPDCNEDGSIDSGDAICQRRVAATAPTVCVNQPAL